MKRSLLMLLFACFSVYAMSQTVVISEDFEGSTFNFTSSSTGSTGWGLSSRVSNGGTYSDSAKAVIGDTIFLTSNTFSTLNNYYVELKFAHIAKISVTDGGFIEYSTDGGTTWTKVTSQYYNGNAIFATQTDNFRVIGYPGLWDPANPSSIHDSMFVEESFDLSSLIGNTANAQIRFGVAGGVAPNGHQGWFLDDIQVIMEVDELIPPVLTMIPPIVQDTVYGAGPFAVTTSIVDSSGVDTAFIVYTVWPDNITSTIGMNMVQQDTFTANIPFPGFGRSVSYYVKAIDSSMQANTDSTSSYSFFCKFSSGGSYQIGNGTTVNGPQAYPCPYANYWWGNKEQYLILASELQAMGVPAGPISSLGMDVANLNAVVPLNNFQISMGHTTQTSITSFATGLTTVFSPSAAYMPTLGINTHVLTTNFVWDGSSNLVIEICSNNSDYVTNGNAAVNQHSTAFTSTVNNHQDAANVCGNPGSPSSYSQRPNLYLEIQGVNALSNDIGVFAITNPTGGVLAGQNFDVNVQLKNFGIDTITSATVSWEFDGVAQTPYSFTDSLKADSTSADLTLGTENVTLGVHTIKAWSENPNGNSDNNIANDTANFTFYACSSLLSGVYTIGGTSPDFNTFSDAVLALDQCGVNGPVTFNVASGTYTEQISLNTINGVSATNTVTFQSTAGDSSLVTLTYDANGSSDNYVVKLNGTNYITFKDMSIVAADSTEANAFVLGGNLHDFTLENCVVSTAVKAIAGGNEMNLISTTDSIGDNITIQNNALLNGATAVILSGETTPSSNWVIQNNIIDGHYDGGIEVSNSMSPMIKMNTIAADTSSIFDSYNAISVVNSAGSAAIEMNHISTKNTLIAYGIVVAGSEFDSLNPTTIVNNMILLHVFSSSTTLSAGVLVNETKNVQVYHNTMHVFGTQNNGTSLCLYDGANPATETKNIYIVNNMLTNDAGGYIYYINNVDTADFSSNYNNLYDWGTGNAFAYLGGPVTDLATWQTETGDAANSVSYDPYYLSATDLHVANNALNNIGTPLASVSNDIDGDVRSATTPDMGADEFDATPFDAYLLEVTSPIGMCGMSSAEVVTIRIKNVGSSDISGSLTAKYQLVGSSTVVSESVPSTIVAGDTLDYAFTTTADMDVTALGLDSVFQIVAWVELTNDPVQQNDTAMLDVNSMYQPPAPVTATTTCNYGQSVDLTAISNDSLYWYASMTDSVELHVGSIFNTGLLYDTTTFYVAAKAGGGILAITEVTQYQGFGQGNTNPLPSYIAGDDFVELSNVGSGPVDITGYTYNREGAGAFTYSLPSITLQSGEVLILATYGGSTDNPANKYYVAANSSVSSGSSTGHYITDPNGAVVDAVALNGYTFSSGPVTAADWSGAIASSSGRAGVSRMLYDNNLPSDWYISDASNPQTLGTFNPQLQMAGGSGCSSARVPLQVNVIGFPTEDAGVSAIVNPLASTPAGTSQIIKAEITNYGINTLTSVDIPWELNGVAQPTFQYTGSIPYQGVDTVHLDTITLIPSVYTVKAWTALPNTVNDTINTNDTTFYSFNACLNGIYTIGDTAGGAPFDFASINDAVGTLQGAGVCGHVTFILDTDTFNERFNIQSIPGVGPNSTVTFTSKNGDSTGTVLHYTTSSSAAWMMKIHENYITFDKLTLSTNGGSSFGRIAELSNKVEHFTIKNCILNGVDITSSSSNYALIYTDNSAHSNLNFINNEFNYGSHGIYAYGSSSSVMKHITVKDNEFMNFAASAAYLYYGDSILVDANIMHSAQVSGYKYGIYSYYAQNHAVITNNNILLYPGGSWNTAYGIYAGSMNADPASRNLVANNMISIQGGNYNAYGIYSTSTSNTNYYYNSINVNTDYTNTNGMYVAWGSGGVDIVNNILKDSSNYAIYVYSTGNIDVIDHNAYYSNHSDPFYWGYAISSLADFQTANSQDANSLFVDPMFVSQTDLHMLSTQLSAYGTPLTAVQSDIDGNPRGTLGTTIGAHEIPLLPFDLGVIDIFGIPDSTFEGYSYTLDVPVRNFGLNTVLSYDVSYTINNGTPVLTTITDSIQPGQIDTVSLGTIISPAGLSDICVKSVLAADTNAFNDGICQDFFGVPTKDAYVTELLEIAEGCDLGLDTIKVWVKNIGIDTINASTQTSPTHMYYITDLGNTPVQEVFPTVLAPDDSVLFEFSTLANFSTNHIVDSVFDVYVWIDFVGDNVSYNDTVYQEVVSMHTPLSPTTANVTIPYGTPATLTASAGSNDTIAWFTDSIAGTEIFSGSAPFVSNILYSDTAFWVEARTGIPPVLYTLGNGTQTNTSTGYPCPLANYWWGNKEQYLILASEMHALGLSAGPITMITYDVDNLNAVPALNQFEISMKQTTITNLNAFESGLTTVYSPGSYTPVLGINSFVFTTPFVWDGVSNLVIQMCSNNSDYVTNGNASVKQHTTSFTSTLNSHADQAGVCSSPGTPTSYQQRPNIGIEIAMPGCSSGRVKAEVTVQPQAANDVGVISIDGPLSGVYLGDELLMVTVENFGTADQSNVPVSVIIDDTITITETISATIPANDVYQYTFGTTGDLSIVGNTYELVAHTGMTPDNTALNDTTKMSVTHFVPNYCVSGATSDIYSEIGSFSFGGKTNVSPAPYTANYTDYTALAPGTISVGNDFDIEVDVVFNTTSFSGGYVEVYIDYNKDGILTEPDEIAFGGPYTNAGGVLSGVVTVPSSAQPGNTFLRVVVEHYADAAGTLPCGTYSYGETEDYMINILPKIPQDAGVKKIITPSIVALNAAELLAVEVVNFGSDPITSVDVVYELNGNTPVTSTYTTAIDTSSSATVDLGNIPLDYGNNDLCVYTVLAGDTNYFNDEACLTIFREATEVAPYFEDFETNNLWFNDTLNTQWEYGEPTTSTITGAYSGTKAWATVLDTVYKPQVFPGGDFLYTPKIVTIGLDSAFVSFWHTMNVDANEDFGVIQVSVNNAGFNTFGTMTDTLGTNWYNDDIGGAHGWSYANQAWQESKYHIDFLDQFGDFYQADTLQFRFAFYSDGTTSGDGWAIDDFNLGLYKAPIDAGVASVDAPSGSTALGDSTQVTVTLENYGLNALSNFDVSYTVNGTVIATEQFTGTLATSTTTPFTFATKFVAPIDDYEVCAYTSVIGDAYPTNDGDCEPITADPAHYDASATIVWPTSTDTTSLSYNPHVYIQIENHGTNTLNSILVEYTVNGNVTQDTWTGTLPQGGTAQFTFTDQFQSPLGNYQLCVRTVVPNDGNPANDEDCDFLYGVVTSVDNLADNDFILNQNQPNPVKDDYVITYELPNSGDVHFELHNSLGQLIMVLEEDGHAGSNTIKLNASQLNAGVYYYSVEYNGMRKTLQMVVTK